MRKLLAWCVHFYTALGLVAAAGIAVSIIGSDYYRAFLLMLVATAIDATDGWAARKVKVKQVLPGFDGRRLDDLIDFHTYTTLPLLLIWHAQLLPCGQEWWLVLPLLASAYGFSQVEAKTPDGYFLGFPSYWNIVAFYLYALHMPSYLALGIVALCALLTFVPSRYLYPSVGGPFCVPTLVGGGLWAVLLLLILLIRPSSTILVWLSLLYPIYYLGVSWAISVQYWRHQRFKADQSEMI